MSIIDMINEEIYDYNMLDNYSISKEECFKFKGLGLWGKSSFRIKMFESVDIIQWLCGNEEYQNWVYNLDKKKEVDNK